MDASDRGPSQTSSPPVPSEKGSASQVDRIQLRYKLSTPTFKTMCTIGRSPTRKDVLQKACLASEFRSFRIKKTEGSFFRFVNDNTPIPYPVPGSVSQPSHKVSLLVQIDLLTNGWPPKLSAAARKELHQEKGRIYHLLERVLRCLADILGQRRDGRGLSVVLDVLRSVKAGVWEGNGTELLQVEGIGPAKMGKLKEAGISHVKQLRQLDFFHIERLLSRNPPFGHDLLQKLSGFPVLGIVYGFIRQFEDNGVTRRSPNLVGQSRRDDDCNSSTPIWIFRLLLTCENEERLVWRHKTPWVTLVIEGEDGRLVWFWRGSIKGIQGDKEMVVGLSVNAGEKLQLTLASEGIVGTQIRETVMVGVESTSGIANVPILEAEKWLCRKA